MAAIATPYDHARWGFATKKIDWVNDTIKMLLVTSSYVPDYVNHKFLSDITNEVAGNGYVPQTLASKTSTEGAGKTVMASAAVVFSASGGSIVYRYAILYQDTGVAGTSILLGAILMDNTGGGQNITIPDASTDTITPDATNGWMYL